MKQQGVQEDVLVVTFLGIQKSRVSVSLAMPKWPSGVSCTSKKSLRSFTSPSRVRSRDIMFSIWSPLFVTMYVYFTSLTHSSSGFGIISLQFVLVPWASSTKQVMLMVALHDVRGVPVVITSSEVSFVCNPVLLDVVVAVVDWSDDTGSPPSLASTSDERVTIAIANKVKSIVEPRQRVTFIVQYSRWKFESAVCFFFNFNNVLCNFYVVGGRKWYRRNAIDALDLHSPSSPCVGLHAQNIMYLFEVRASDLMKKPLKSFREKRKLRKIIRNYVYNTERIFSPPVAPRA